MSSGFIGKLNFPFVNALKAFLCPIIQEVISFIEISKFTEGPFKIKNTRIMIYNLLPENTEIILCDPNIIKISLNKLKGGGYTEIKFKLIKEKVSLEIQDISYLIKARIETFHEGDKMFPKVEILSSETDIKFDVKFKGTISPVFNLFHKQISKYIKKKSIYLI